MADTAEALFGWPTEEIVGKHFAFLTDASSMPFAKERYEAIAEHAGPRRARAAHARPAGRHHVPAEVTTMAVFEDGRVVGGQGTVRDVGERERLADELRRSEERYRYLVQNAPDIVWSIGADAKLNFLSDATERLTGFRPDELLGKHFGAIVHESSREVTQIDWSDALNAAVPGAARPGQPAASRRLADPGRVHRGRVGPRRRPVRGRQRLRPRHA